MGDLTRQYGKLTPDERLALWLQADARGDSREGSRVLESCPQATYRMRDHAFRERADGLIHVVLFVAAALAASRARLEVLCAAQGVVDLMGRLWELGANDAYAAGFADGMARAKGKAPAPADVDAYASDLWTRAERSADALQDATGESVTIGAARVRNIVAAFDGWTRDTFTTPGADVLRVLTGDTLAWTECDPDAAGDSATLAAARAIQDAKPDPADVAEWRAAFDAQWSTWLERADA